MRYERAASLSPFDPPVRVILHDRWLSLEDRVLTPDEAACSQVTGHRSRVHLRTDSTEAQVPALLSSVRNSSTPLGILDERAEHGEAFGLVVLNYHPE